MRLNYIDDLAAAARIDGAAMGTPELDEEIVRCFMQHVVAVNQAHAPSE